MKIDMKLLTQTNCKNTGYERFLLRIAINTQQPMTKKTALKKQGGYVTNTSFNSSDKLISLDFLNLFPDLLLNLTCHFRIICQQLTNSIPALA